jgi:hypothetical protein
MSDFEDRVIAASSLEMDDRFKVLEKLNPALARQYAISVNPDNERRLKIKEKLTGFGGFAPFSVDTILQLARDANSRISKQNEEALLIILLAKTPWKGGAKEHMIEKLEQNLKFEASSKSIASDAPQLLKETGKIDFVSGGDKHKGTGFHYTPTEYQLVAAFIAQNKIGAWEVAARRSFLLIPAGEAGAWGFYDPDTNDMYIVDGLSSRDRQCTFVHVATLAIHDVRNRAEGLANYLAADGFIAQAFVALSLGKPYSKFPNRPEEVASGGASKLLQTAMGDRDKKWGSKFRKAYDDVVDACVALGGPKGEQIIINMLEDKKGQDAETAAVKKILTDLKRKK